MLHPMEQNAPRPRLTRTPAQEMKFEDKPTGSEKWSYESGGQAFTKGQCEVIYHGHQLNIKWPKQWDPKQNRILLSCLSCGKLRFAAGKEDCLDVYQNHVCIARCHKCVAWKLQFPYQRLMVQDIEKYEYCIGFDKDIGRHCM